MTPSRPVQQWFDAIYVVTVKTFTQRIEHIRAELGQAGIPFEFVFEHDAAEMDPALVARTFAPSDMRPGAQSLVLKNIHIWERSVRLGHQRVMIIEDDAVLRPDFALRVDEAMRALEGQPPGWMLYLGGLDAKLPASYFLSPGPLVELPVGTTEACIHDLEAMRRRLAWIGEHRITRPVDWLIREVDPEVGTRQFWLRHPVVEQGSITGLFRTELDRNRIRHSLVFNSLRNRWRKFYRRGMRGALVRAGAALGLLRT